MHLPPNTHAADNASTFAYTFTDTQHTPWGLVLRLQNISKRLQVVQTFSAGLDHTIPLVPPGITLCSSKGANDSAVAEWVLAALLAGYRQLPTFFEQQQKGKWNRAIHGLTNPNKPSVAAAGQLQRLQVCARVGLGVVYCICVQVDVDQHLTCAIVNVRILEVTVPGMRQSALSCQTVLSTHAWAQSASRTCCTRPEQRQP